MVDYEGAVRGAIGANIENLPMSFELANRTNQFNVNQALRGYSKIQPSFRENQSLIGRNVASFARGELPSDVVGSIGRAAAQRGIQGGFGMGINAGGANSALGGLNLRNLGLTSLDLSRAGTSMAMQANQNAAAMTPALFDASQSFFSPSNAVNAEFNNANILNRWNEANAGIVNNQAVANTQLNNDTIMQQAQMAYQQQLQQSAAVQSAATSAAGVGIQLGQQYQAGRNSQGFYNTSMGATGQNAFGSTATSTPYGYANRPVII